MRSCSPSRRLQIRRSAVAPLTILCLSLLVGVTALVIDGGTLMEARRHVQAAADAAALAGAGDLYSRYLSNQGIDVGGTAKASALATASANGFSNDGIQTIVTIRTASQTYQSGPNAGKTIPAGYIEVVIQYNASHLFSGVFGSGTSPIRARAVARGRSVPLNNNGLMALNLNVSAALNVSSTGGLSVNGGIAVSSSSSSALSVNTSAKVTATQFTLNSAMGGSGGGGLLGSILSLLGSVLSLLSGPGGAAATVVVSPPAADPLLYLPSPSQVGLTTRGSNLNITSGRVDLYPGVYNGGIKISGSLFSPTVVTLHANSDGSPGIYYLSGQNGLQVSGWATLQTASGEAGIMIYNDWSDSTDSINLNTYVAITLAPPTSGTYRGLSIFSKRGTSACAGPPVTLNANGTANVTGTIYAAHASVSLATNSSSNVMAGQVIADTVSASGQATITIDPGTQPVLANQRLLGLVE